MLGLDHRAILLLGPPWAARARRPAAMVATSAGPTRLRR
ncbi:hypothetical protein RGE_45990 [Rubrivivax gelatinosus IL144]|uniref:Uncharacterized protein n=1 Tax=Rubrivivax gelatinosus (strain NBRC 100245 / IL144) TaxID=983917 RepID=I0HY45_RUBGI|nr:hypothetical protein RGE_45990 [Rubrivivax gelatinosus IL144]